MNITQMKCLVAVGVLAMIGFGPISLTCLIGMYVVIRRPAWFHEVVNGLYHGNPGSPTVQPPRQGRVDPTATGIRVKCILSLALLLLLDIAPVPVTGAIALYVVIARPPWFEDLVAKVYAGTDG